MKDSSWAGRGDSNDDAEYIDQTNRVRKLEQCCPKCDKITIYFRKPDQHKDIDCEHCQEPLIRWEIRQKI